MKEGLLIGTGVVAAGVFVGFVAYKLLMKNPKALQTARKKASNVARKVSKAAIEAKQAFAEGFEGAQARGATV